MSKNKLVLPPIPINHLTLKEFNSLRKYIKKVTGYEIKFQIVDKKSKKVLGIV